MNQAQSNALKLARAKAYVADVLARWPTDERKFAFWQQQQQEREAGIIRLTHAPPRTK